MSRVDDSPSDREFIVLNHAAAPREAATAATSPSRPSRRRPYSWIAGIAAGLIPATLIGYVWAADHFGSGYSLTRGLLFLAVCTSVLICAIAGMQILRTRDDDRRAEALQATIRAEVATILAEVSAARASSKRHLAAVSTTVAGNQAVLAGLADLPEVLNDRVTRQGKVFVAEVQALRDLMEQRLAGLEQRDRANSVDAAAMAERYVELTRTFADRLAAIETKLDSKKVADVPQLEGDDRYLAGFADGLAGRALGEGNVVPLNGVNGHGRAG